MRSYYTAWTPSHVQKTASNPASRLFLDALDVGALVFRCDVRDEDGTEELYLAGAVGEDVGGAKVFARCG